jgi:benzoyl-CoA 2,3-epoxidase subunit A
MDTATLNPVIKQHLIDPEICIRCNTCEATCPVGAITHDDRNYVVDADKCNLCMACIDRQLAHDAARQGLFTGRATHVG